MIRFVLLAGLTLSLPAQAVVFTFSGTALGRYAQHTDPDPGGPASQRLELNLSQKIALPPRWTFFIGGRGFYENVYSASKIIYPESLRKQDSYEIRAQDLYAEYKEGDVIIRAGNQQVVWGETFGNLYADIVNPRDFRDGSPIDAASSRRSVPMLFGKYIGEGWSAEAVVIPRPEFHVLPLPGSDFAPISNEEFPFTEVELERERYWWGTEYGARATKTFDRAATDVAIFAMDHYDRYPFYEVQPGTVPGALLRLRERHARLKTFGGGAAKEFSGYVTRVEVVHNMGRILPVKSASDVAFITTDEDIGVLSVDLPTWRRLNFSAQISNSRLSENKNYVMRDRDQSNLGVRAQIGLFNSSNLEIMATKSISDQGTRLQADFMTPLTSSLEVHGGLEIFGGPTASEYGRVHEASRVYISLKSYLSALPEKPLQGLVR